MSPNPHTLSLAAPRSRGRALPPSRPSSLAPSPIPAGPGLKGFSSPRSGVPLRHCPSRRKFPQTPGLLTSPQSRSRPRADPHLLGRSDAPFPGEAALDSQRPLKMAILCRRTPPSPSAPPAAPPPRLSAEPRVAPAPRLHRPRVLIPGPLTRRVTSGKSRHPYAPRLPALQSGSNVMRGPT